VLQVLHLGSPHLNVPNQKIGEATNEASTKATSCEKENPQKQIKINNEYDGDVAKKKETRRGRRRHSIYNQDAKVMSINQKKKDDLAQLKCYK
jgi:phage protein D